VEKKIRKKGKQNLGKFSTFAYFVWVGKINAVLNNKRIFDPENFWKLF